eukprot:TRINITY_DN1485_c0_g1_i1.p1 TRINITY_DN1485_c0_g1~~TRINITY_DN1485_c0_g1_i1.p1  ORF type:complete len:236 (-),score=70.07 TRINITY_DN1485_c0_g1_i1:95-802(-)
MADFDPEGLPEDWLETFRSFYDMTVFEQAKVFMRSFFRDDDIDCRHVCQMAKQFRDYYVEDPNLSLGEISKRRALTFLQMVDKPMSLMELKAYLEMHDSQRSAMSFIEFALYYYEKPMQELFTKDVDGNLELLSKMNHLKQDIRKLDASKGPSLEKIQELQAIVDAGQSAKVYEANRKIEEIKQKELKPIDIKISELEENMKKLQEDIDREGSHLDEILMEMDLHEDYPELFEIM